MARRILLASAVLCLVFLGLSQLPDTGFLGIHEEPGRIAFYGATGLLSGLAGLVAVGSGIYLVAARAPGFAPRRKRLVIAVMGVIVVAIAATVVMRLLAGR